MKNIILIGFICFWAGFTFARWDAVHGADTGEKLGRATRSLLGLPPIAKE